MIKPSLFIAKDMRVMFRCKSIFLEGSLGVMNRLVAHFQEEQTKDGFIYIVIAPPIRQREVTTSS